MSICIVFVSNMAYINKFINTYNQLLNNGNYNGNVCLIIGNDLINTYIINNISLRFPNLIIKYFKDIIFNDYFYSINKYINSDNRNITKSFQWHKLYLFHTFFKQWYFILYIDCGMNIYNDIIHILNEKENMKLIAHHDGYPYFQWKLKDQFDNKSPIFNSLNNKFDLNIDYFQTGIMLYDTNIIKDYTFNNLYKLACIFPISKTNEQGIISLYFTNVDNYFKPLRIFNNYYNLYDYNIRDIYKKYIMTKHNSINYKYTAIIIDSRITDLFNIILDNFYSKLNNDWMFIIITTNNNFSFIKELIHNSFNKELNRTTIIKLNIQHIEYDNYSKLFYFNSFYSFIHTDIFMIFQLDSLLSDKYSHLIYNYMDYDFIGSPFYKSNEEYYYVGCGGLSIRKKSKMLQIINDINYNNEENKKLPEDLFFCQYPNINKPSYEIALNFCSGMFFSSSPVAMHQTFRYINENEKNILSLQFSKFKEVEEKYNNLQRFLNNNNNIDIDIDLIMKNPLIYNNYNYYNYYKL